MEKIMTVEEKVRRAEEIYERRRKNTSRPVATVNIREKKDIKLLKKMIIQLLVCVAIYLIIYTVQNNNYIFSEDFTKKVNEVLSYNINFQEIYEKIKNNVNNNRKQEENNQEQVQENQIEEEQVEENKTEQIEENKIQEEKAEENSVEGIGGTEEEIKQEDLSQEEQDIINIKNTTSFIKPIEGVISSKFGQRESATGNVPKNHTGTDIAANLGTKIKSATDGEVVLASEEGDYRKTFKNTNRRSKYNLCTL